MPAARSSTQVSLRSVLPSAATPCDMSKRNAELSRAARMLPLLWEGNGVGWWAEQVHRIAFRWRISVVHSQILQV